MDRVEQIRCLAEKFRKAILRAVQDGELRTTTFPAFPKGCCDMASELLAQFLLDKGIETFMINGQSRKDNSHHVWLRTKKDNIIIDITAYQFEYLYKEEPIPKTIVGEELNVHKEFSECRYCEKPMCLKDNIYETKYRNSSNFRQKCLYDAYTAVLKYI